LNIVSDESERGQARGGRHAVGVPSAQRVVLVEHRIELRGRAMHAGRGPVGDRLVHHLPRQHVLGAAHALAHVEEALEVDDALATRSSSSTVTSQPVTARTIVA